MCRIPSSASHQSIELRTSSLQNSDHHSLRLLTYSSIQGSTALQGPFFRARRILAQQSVQPQSSGTTQGKTVQAGGLLHLHHSATTAQRL